MAYGSTDVIFEAEAEVSQLRKLLRETVKHLRNADFPFSDYGSTDLNDWIDKQD